MHEFDKHSLGDIALYPVFITKKDELGGGAWILYFKKFFSFSSGQVIAISMLKGEPPRLYSICSGPDDDEIAILFKLNPTGFLTPRLVKLDIGDQLWVSQAFGSFYGSKDADCWIAAGTGIAPFVSMHKPGFYEGRLTEYIIREPIDVHRKYFVCGSSEMVVQVRDLLIGRGVDYDHIIVEIYF
jgi:ferredoxin-NADP reductase